MINNIERNKFKDDLTARLLHMINTDAAVNDGQLSSFYGYFLSKHEEKYPETEWLSKLDDEKLKCVLRLVMVYSTLALTVHDDNIFGAAVEVFPMDLIPACYVTFAKDAFKHIEENPADDTRKLFIQGLGSQQFPMRMDFLRKSLNNALVGVF